MLSKKSKIEELPKSRESLFLAASVCCKPQQDTYEALWSISCDTMWPPTSARVRRAGGVEKFSSPVRKPFFDSIGQIRTHAVRRARTTMSALVCEKTVRHPGFDFKCCLCLRPDQRAPQAARPMVRSTAAETR